MHKKLVVLLLCCFVGAPVAQEAYLEDKSFNEIYSSDVPVSGAQVVGVLLSSNNESKKKALSNFFLVNPSATSQSFCFNALSIDGTYVSKNQYTLAPNLLDASNKSVSLEYPTKFAEVISSFRNEQLALLAYEGECDLNFKNRRYVISSRFESAEPQHIKFLISSFRSDVFMRLKGQSGRIPAQCARIEVGKRTAYDTVCEVAINLLKDNIYEADIMYRKNGRLADQTKFTVITKSVISKPVSFHD